jgi:large subunit ribosomal protein L10
VPTDQKVKDVEDIQKLLETCTAAISTDYTGLKVDAMTALRRALRQRGVTFRVVKNRITYLAADAAGKPAVKEMVQGPTGIAFGFEDPVEPAKALADFMTSTRAPLRIRGGILGDRALSAGEVASLAALPSKDQLIANFLGQLQAPITSLAYVLNAPVASLARVIQRHIEQADRQDGD